MTRQKFELAASITATVFIFALYFQPYFSRADAMRKAKQLTALVCTTFSLSCATTNPAPRHIVVQAQEDFALCMGTTRISQTQCEALAQDTCRDFKRCWETP
jgi:hypothetical protein